MPGKHTERAFEDAIEHGLLDRGWSLGEAATFDPERALQWADFCAFVIC